MEKIDPEAPMFETDYLTTTDETVRHDSLIFRLGHPNLEVRRSLNRALLDAVTNNPHRRLTQDEMLHDLLLAAECRGPSDLFGSLLAGIPYEPNMSSRRGQHESHYATVLYVHANASSLTAQLEDSSCQGRI